jgi:hypothetical protein
VGGCASSNPECDVFQSLVKAQFAFDFHNWGLQQVDLDPVKEKCANEGQQEIQSETKMIDDGKFRV